MLRKIHDQVPEVQTGYILNPARSYFSVVVPEETVNLVTDPHFELNTAYDGLGATLALQSTVCKRSRRCYQVTAASSNKGIRYVLAANLTANNYYSFSVDLLGVGDFSLYFGDDTTGAVASINHAVTASGIWQRFSVSGYIRESNVGSLCVIAHGLAVFYVDGFQVENKPYPTTFASGALASNQRGVTDYAWLGAPNRSVSFRAANAIDGGRVIPFSDLGLDITSFVEFGYGEQANQFEEYAIRSGALYTGTRASRRTFTLLGSIQSDDVRQLLRKRFLLGAAMTGGDENARPIKLLCQLFDCDLPVSEQLEITAVYKSGLGGNTDNLYQERVSISFETGDTLLAQTGMTTATLTLATVLASTAGIVAVQGDGVVTGTGVAGDPGFARGMVIGPDNNLYFARTDSIIQYNGITASTIHTVAAGTWITAMTIGPDGRLFFATITTNGLSAGKLFAISLATGSVDPLGTLATNLIGPIATLRAGKNGLLYIGGLFSTIQNSSSGTVSARNIASLNVATGILSAMGTGLGTDTGYASFGVMDIAVDNNGWVWAAGQFSNGNVVATDIHHIAIWSGGAWQKVGNFSTASPVTIANIKAARINKLAYDSTHDVMYVGGLFQTFTSQETTPWITDGISNICVITRDDGIPGFGIGGNAPIYTGTHTVTRMGHGLTYFGHHAIPSYAGEVLDLAIACNGDLAVAGDFGYAFNYQRGNILENLLIKSTGIALWDGGIKRWTQPPFSIPTIATPPAEAYVIRTVEYGGNCGTGSTQATDFSVGTQAFAPLLTTTFLAPGSADAFFFDVGIATNITSTYVNMIDNGSGVSVRPVFEIAGPGTLQFIKNLTTGRSIIINDKTLFTGETITLDTRQGGNGLYSSNLGDQTYAIDRDCSFPDFNLVPGINEIIVKMSDTGASTRVVMRWKKRYASLDALGMEANEL